MPFALRRVRLAMYPRRDNSAATKYSPATPERPVESGDRWVKVEGLFGVRLTP